MPWGILRIICRILYSCCCIHINYGIVFLKLGDFAESYTHTHFSNFPSISLLPVQTVYISPILCIRTTYVPLEGCVNSFREIVKSGSTYPLCHITLQGSSTNADVYPSPVDHLILLFWSLSLSCPSFLWAEMILSCIPCASSLFIYTWWHTNRLSLNSDETHTEREKKRPSELDEFYTPLSTCVTHSHWSTTTSEGSHFYMSRLCVEQERKIFCEACCLCEEIPC